MAEFAYNNAVHSATMVTPFMANYGMNPRADLSSATTLTDEPNELSDRMRMIDEFLTTNLNYARDVMKRYADRTREPAVKYKPGDMVLLSMQNIKSRRPKAKWTDKRTGPYTIVKEAHEGSESYVLDLPTTWNVYPVFHTSLLTPYKMNTLDNRVQPPPPPVIIDGDEEFEIEKVVDCRKRYNRTQYLVKWTGYPVDEKNNWIDEDGLDNAQDILDEFLSTYKPPKPKRKKKK